MKNNNTVTEMKVIYNTKKQKTFDSQSKWDKVINWTQNTLFPQMKKAADAIVEAVKSIDWKLPKVGGINWVGVLAVIILANMAQNGMLDEMPNLKWLLETTIRLVEWLIGVLRSLLEWVIELPEPSFFGIREFENWMRSMFGI